MNIVIFGLGYVGVTAAACLLKQGHRVIGVDVSPDKVALVATGRSPVSEPGIGEMLAAGHADGRLTATAATGGLIAGAEMTAEAGPEIAIVCVGTPSLSGGDLDVSQVRHVATEIGAALRDRTPRRDPFMVVVRSTMPPGAMRDVVLPAIVDAAGESPGAGYEVVYNPEFLRESSAVADYMAPPRIVIGERIPGAANGLRALYDGIDAPLFEMGYSEAELLKFADNGFHALKVAFANEIGRLAIDLNIATDSVIDAFVADTRLNISASYLRPGGAFGGSCLPKDLRAITTLGAARGVDLPVMSNVLASNAAHKRFLAERVISAAAPGARVLLIGLSFKADTDDLRESPLVDLAETLLGKGYDLSIFDPDLAGRRLVGANLAFVQDRLPHLSRLLVGSVPAAGPVSLVVIGKPAPGALESLDASVPVIDLSRL